MREQAGRWLIKDMKKAWDRGDMKYIIPPGTYAISEPFPLKRDSLTTGENKVTLVVDNTLYVEEYPPVEQPVEQPDLDVWNMGENAFQQVR